MTAAVADFTTEIIVEADFVGDLVEEKPKNDPMVVRWGYNPGQRGIPNSPLRTGIRSPFIPVGKFIAHNKFQTPFENCTIDEYKPHEFIGTVSAEESQIEVENALKSWGYQVFFYGETDYALVTAINAVILPPLSQIRALFGAQSPIPQHCEAEDEFDLGEPREHCATCHLLWVNSEALTVYMEEVAAKSLTVNVLSDNRMSPKQVRPTLAQMNTAREAVLQGLQIYIRKANEDWATIVSELDNKVRNKLNDSEHYLRKDLHQPKPQNKDAEIANRQMKQNQEANQDFIAALAEQSQQNQQMMMQIAQQGAQTQAQIAQIMALFGGALGLPQMPANSAETPKPQGKKTEKPDGK